MPDYQKIYWDMILKQSPDRITEFSSFFEKKKICVLDVLKINNTLFSNSDRETKMLNSRLVSYDETAIFEILEYQKKYNLSNAKIGEEFNVSRNTIAKWKRVIPLVEASV